jgi:curved DNA-binding protein CbpA
MPDFYEVLQVSPRAEPEVIRAAYRTLARKYHPDHGGDARRMIDLNDAWDVLGDPNRRAAYDASRTASRTEASRPPAPRAPMSPTWPQPATPREAGVTHAGPPPGNPSGTVLDFGRYAGWSLGEIARRDVDYLEWLQRATFGRKLRAEIDALLRQRTPAAGRTPFGQQGSRRR